MNPLTRHEQACRVVRFGKKTRKRSEVAIAFTEPAPAFWSRADGTTPEPESPK
jgi:hypothetical protein